MATSQRVFNFNIGVLGHVDAGKTSLVAALSTLLSTAALDKNPQSKERGITLDLGFSSFNAGPLPPHLAHLPYDELQITLVDCPGHASLIKTIIGGVQIIDMLLLVIDVTKGLQAQTAECLVVAELVTPHMLIVLNKIDLLPQQKRGKCIKEAAKALSQTLAMTKFAQAPMMPVSAMPGSPLFIEELKQQMINMVPPQDRAKEGPFIFSIDHCFAIKGQGTVLTGTVLSGSVSLGDIIDLPALKIQKTVKSMQAFRRPVTRASKGDRVGICVSGLDPTLIERGLASTPKSVPTFQYAVALVEKVRFFSGRVPSRSKFHVSIGHETVMAEVNLFGLLDGEGSSGDRVQAELLERMEQLSVGSTSASKAPTFSAAREHLIQEELYGLEGRPVAQDPFKEEEGRQEIMHHGPQFAHLKFQVPVTSPTDSLLIGAKLDSDNQGEACRLAFYGRIVHVLPEGLPFPLRTFKLKTRLGTIERIQPDGTAICRGLFKKESDMNAFIGQRVLTGKGEEGVIEGGFGKSGKAKVSFRCPIDPSLARLPHDNKIVLTIKKFKMWEC